MNYELLWQDAGDPEVICVMLRCCAGPELQVRRGSEVLFDEIFSTPAAARERAQRLLEDGFDSSTTTPEPR